jgi:branched-chain amino acid transport system permease protein
MGGGENWRAATAVLVLIVALVAWWHAGYFGHELLQQVAILGIFAMSLDLLVGFAGMVSLGHAAFYGVGAYATAALQLNFGWSPLEAMAGAICVGAVGALIVGGFVVRLSGVFFIMVTLAVGEALHAYLFRDRAFGGDDGMSGIERLDLSALGVSLDDPAAYSMFVICVAGVVYLLLESIVRSPFGHLLRAIHGNPIRVAALGCPVFRYKLAAFTLAGAIAALAGSLTAQQTAFISPELLTWTTSGEALIVVIVGGMGSLVGPVIGAAVIVLATHHVSGLTDYWMMWMGLFFVGVVLFAGDGVYGLAEGLRRKLGRWRRASH